RHYRPINLFPLVPLRHRRRRVPRPLRLLPSQSQPWQPTATLIFIDSPWLVWVLTFIYSCAKACCIRGGDGRDRQIPKRQITRNASASISVAASEPKGGGSCFGGKQDSVASSNGSEIQLASSV
ncbi:hypothetical protein PHJA_002937700, partial [Phtheirospermum japonicum]